MAEDRAETKHSSRRLSLREVIHRSKGRNSESGFDELREAIEQNLMMDSNTATTATATATTIEAPAVDTGDRNGEMIDKRRMVSASEKTMPSSDAMIGTGTEAVNPEAANDTPATASTAATIAEKSVTSLPEERKRPPLESVRRATVSRRRPSVKRSNAVGESLKKLDTIEKVEASLSNVTHEKVDQSVQQQQQRRQHDKNKGNDEAVQATMTNKVRSKTLTMGERLPLQFTMQQQQSLSISSPLSPSAPQQDEAVASKPKRRLSYHQASNSFGDMMSNNSELLAKLKSRQID